MIKKHPDLNYLKTFFYVVRYNGFTKAAQELHVQQPVVSRAIKLLEEDLGYHLLERQKKQTILTLEGQKLYQLAEQIFTTVDKIRPTLDGEEASAPGVLSLAASDSLSSSLLRTLIKNIEKKYPNTLIHHQAGSSTNYLPLIQKGEVDFGLFFNVPDLPADLHKTKLADVRFEYVVSNKIKNQPQLLNHFIGHHESPTTAPLYKKYKAKQKGAKIVAISNSSQTRKNLVLDGIGVSVLPLFLVREEIKKGLLTTTQEHETLGLYMLERQSSYRTQLKREVTETVRSYLSEV